MGGNSNYTLSDTVVCYSGRIGTNNGLWQGDNPLAPALPIFAQQMIVIITLIRLLRIVFKPLKIPRVIPEIVGGLLLSPSLLGEWHYFRLSIFPSGSVLVLDTLGNLGVLYFFFLLGLELDIKTMLQPGMEALHIAMAGAVLPFITGVGVYFLLVSGKLNVGGLFFCSAALTVTSFTVLTQILADLKLLHGDIGRTAMSSAIISDLFSWVLLAMGVAISGQNKALETFGVLGSTAIFALLCCFLVSPTVSWSLKGSTEGQNLSKFHICLILTGVVLVALMADLCGAHSFVGAFLFGLCIPDGMLRAVLIEKLEDVVSGVLLPLFYGVSGLKTNLSDFPTDVMSLGKVVLGIGLACLPKVVGAIGVSFFHRMPLLDGMALGVLMNSKGLMALVILNIAREKSVIDDLTFASMLIAIVLMTIVITPLVSVLYKKKRKFHLYIQRTIEGLKQGTELRILACIYSVQNVPGIINLLQVSNASRHSPLYVFALHLIELTGRASAMLVVHSTRKLNGHSLSGVETDADQIVDSFEKFDQENEAVAVQQLTAMSSYTSMHEDICSYAEDKRVALLILPFHLQQKIDGSMEEENPSIRGINRNVLGNAPCSVGIFLDRGFGVQSSKVMRIAMLFFGGPDDREALTYAWRMMGTHGISLTVVRFVPGEDAAEVEVLDIPNKGHGILTILTYNECQKQLDDQFLNDFRLQTVRDEMVLYSELVSNNGEETVSLIKTMDHDYDLYIVGKGDKVVSPLTAGLNDWSECPELGPVGDLLVSSDCAEKVSVLVVQQYVEAQPVSCELEMSESALKQKMSFENYSYPNMSANHGASELRWIP
ncbi:cation/H(+) antiporter 15-like [Malania oleifera]|uniref:cation/H(+) antiporter 15-like n=1 Tax=Malania oleifera TaxID=397392 RepID=UPI0025AE7B06|nr:cation/H(+) antiporter 15-like [Malania oleifera]XP_057950233.1 cation/H(+) antiporter 15-like [Malania oleifera]